VHQREGGSWFSWLVLKAKVRPLVYGWLPLRLRLWIRRWTVFAIVVSFLAFLDSHFFM